MKRRIVLIPSLAPVLLLGLCLSGCSSETELRPGIFLWSGDTGTFDSMFHAKIASAFPPGTAVSELASGLRADGFSVSEAHGTAEYRVPGFPCMHRLMVRWTGVEVVETVNARLGLVCL